MDVLFLCRMMLARHLTMVLDDRGKLEFSMQISGSATAVGYLLVLPKEHNQIGEIRHCSRSILATESFNVMAVLPFLPG